MVLIRRIGSAACCREELPQEVAVLQRPTSVFSCFCWLLCCLSVPYHPRVKDSLFSPSFFFSKKKRG